MYGAMTGSSVRSAVSIITLVGHIAVFFAGMLLGVFGPLRGIDVLQTVLMATPVVGATAMSSLTYVLANETPLQGDQPRVSSLFAFIVLLFPLCMLAAIFMIFYFVYVQVSGFGPEQMKVSLGGIETVFGGYLGVISTKLFGESK